MATRLLARPMPSPRRVVLDAGWALASGEGPEAPADASAWRDIPGALPVAAALSALGQWHLDQAGDIDFDAGTWWFRCRFDRPAQLDGPCRLGLDGLATLAQVSLNGELLLDSRNMFRAWTLDLGARLRPQGNELLIRCHPLATALAQRRARPRWRAPMVSHQQLRWWRTSLLGRTPGWSPPVAAVGPWRPVWLEPADAGHCTHLALHPRLVGDAGHLAVAVDWAEPASVTAVQATLTRASASGSGPAEVTRLALTQGEDGQWRGELVVPEVQRWWPHTHGEPALYDLGFELSSAHGMRHHQPAGRIGFRALSVDRSGDGFRIVVNGEPVFARGACWTPPDTLRLHAGAATTRQLLVRLRDAGLNLLRVSGSLVYESPAFWDACDELGILVWQDLMFANLDYPAEDADFLAEVAAEVDQQLAGWQARPSLAVVCGNSEVEQQAAMWGAPRAQWQPDLFHRHLPARVEALLPGQPWWPSSAHGGAFPFQPAAGTASYYGVGAYRRPLDDARASGLRFATECLAFANIPNDTTLARLRGLNDGLAVRVHSALWKQRSPRDLGAGWDFDDVRDHYVEQLFGERADELRAVDPVRHLMLGRAAVAEAMRAAFDRWRAAGSVCGGAVVWFLRDLWPGAGWGILDDEGGAKSAFHALASVWQPRHLAVIDDGLNGVTLHLVNEGADAVAGQLSVRLLRDGQTPVAQGQSAVSVPGRGVQALPVAALLDDFADATWAYRFGPPVADVLVARWHDDEGGLIAERLCFLPQPAALARRELGLSAQVQALPDGRRELLLSCRTAARAVHIDSETWQANVEFFDLAPDAPRRLRLSPTSGVSSPWRVQVQAINALAPVAVAAGA